jgi:two-component system sensor histidine kinase QseC
VSSIRQVLQRRLLVALGALLLVSGAALLLLTRAHLLSQFDAGLDGKARLLAAEAKYEGSRLDAEFIERPANEFTRPHTPEYLQLRSTDGPVLFRSPSLAGRDLLTSRGGARDLAFDDLSLPDGRSGRSVTLRVVPAVEGGDQPGPSEPVMLTLAQGRQALDASLRAVLAAQAAVGLFLMVGVALVVTRVVPIGLRPLERVATQATRIDAATLDVRFPEAGMPVELAAICARLNELLRRLEISFGRERRFASDVAHELRTPITELRTAAQVVLRWPDAEGALQALREALEISTQMDRIVSSLLALARSEEGRQPLEIEEVDLATAASEGWRPFHAEAVRQGIRVQLETPPIAVATDRGLLSQILTNLFSNAVRYTPAGGEIVCTLGDAGGRVALTVANTTDRLNLEDLPHLFEAFWRKDAARNDRDHVGLGLPLVSAFSRHLRIDVSTALSASRRFAITLRFPREISASPSL